MKFLIIATVLLLGCHRAPATPSHPTHELKGDTYVDSSLGDPSRINPLLASDSASADLVGLIFNGLVKYDKELKIVGDLAESYEIKNGGLEFVFHLRKDVLWQDGEPFNARDVEFTYQRLRDPKVQTPFSSDFELVKSFDVLDEFTIRVRYSKPFAPALESWGIGILPKHVFENGNFNEHPANRNPIGTGPYRFKEWKVSQYVVLEANPHYFEGAPKLVRYVYRIIPDQAVQFLEMRAQGLDSVTLSPDQYLAYDAMYENHARYQYPSNQYTYLAFNLTKPLFQDARVRQAFALAIDKQKLVDGLLLGKGQAITGPYPTSSWAYNKEVPVTPHDPAQALRLLEEAGWKQNAQGLLEKNGERFQFTLMTNQGNKLRSLAAEIIQRELKAIGVDVEIRILEWSTFIRQYVDTHEFDAIILGWNTARDPDIYSMWHSSQRMPGQYNFTSYSNPEVDRLLVEGRQTFDHQKRQTIYHQVHAKIAADVPYIFLYSPDKLLAFHKRFRGIEVAPAGIGWNFREWDVPEGKERYPARVSYEP